MYGFNTVLCLGAAVASIDASTCAHFRADGALSCDEFSHGGDIFDSHWNHAGTGESQWGGVALPSFARSRSARETPRSARPLRQ